MLTPFVFILSTRLCRKLLVCVPAQWTYRLHRVRLLLAAVVEA
jgi:hypothetical protein